MLKTKPSIQNSFYLRTFLFDVLAMVTMESINFLKYLTSSQGQVYMQCAVKMSFSLEFLKAIFQRLKIQLIDIFSSFDIISCLVKCKKKCLENVTLD